MERIGLIGAGYWGANIAASFEATGNAEIAWICDLDEARAKRLTVRRPRAQATRSLDDIFTDKTVGASAPLDCIPGARYETILRWPTPTT